MRRFASWTTAAALVALLLAVHPPTASSHGSERTFVVRSTLDGRTTVPHRIHWVGRPSLPTSEIDNVSFFVDGGKARWIEHHPPYTFADDGGFLVTSFLAPGVHRFTVRARAKDGRAAS